MGEKLITIEKAKREIERLKKYIQLAESYEVSTLEQWVIKEYAYTNSIAKVTKKAISLGYKYKSELITRKNIIDIINGKPNDELHRIVRLAYKDRIRTIKKAKSSYL